MPPLDIFCLLLYHVTQRDLAWSWIKKRGEEGGEYEASVRHGVLRRAQSPLGGGLARGSEPHRAQPAAQPRREGPHGPLGRSASPGRGRERVDRRDQRPLGRAQGAAPQRQRPFGRGLRGLQPRDGAEDRRARYHAGDHVERPEEGAPRGPGDRHRHPRRW